MDREDMEREIRENRFLENGEYNGNMYGTHLDSIRDVIKQGNFRFELLKNAYMILLNEKWIPNCKLHFRKNVCFGLFTKCIENDA